MFETLKRLFKEQRIGRAQLENAVTRGWISEEQKDAILKEGNI